MKKALFAALLLTYFIAVPVVFSHVSAKAPKKPVVVKKVQPKKVVPPKKKVLGAKVNQIISFFFNPANSIVSCSMPDGKTIRVPKKDCDAVTAFWNSHKPSNPGSGGGSSSGGGGNSGGGNNNGGGNNDNSNKPKPTVTAVIVHPCTSSSCNFITNIEVDGSGFTQNTRVELVPSIGGNYVGGDFSTKILTDFYNLKKGTYDVHIYSTSDDIQGVVLPAAVVIN
ncbi:MAG TPA: hypothetical protein VG965_05075 [Patescibacteria group bacterium]|nr:hypothetical protein [Patescibacteria group bacterium]